MNECLRKKMVRYEGNDKCSICLSNLKSTRKNRFVVRLPCFHLYHPNCIEQWVGSCPICRREFYFEYYHYIKTTLHGNKILYINYFLPSFYNLVLWELRHYLFEIKYHSNKKRALKEAKKHVTVRDFSTFFLDYGTIEKKYVQEYRIWRF
jgi:hypothetical protein